MELEEITEVGTVPMSADPPLTLPTLRDKIRQVSADRQFDSGLETLLLAIADEMDKLRG